MPLAGCAGDLRLRWLLCDAAGTSSAPCPPRPPPRVPARSMPGLLHSSSCFAGGEGATTATTLPPRGWFKGPWAHWSRHSS
eukprot:5733782-Pyramimonas_sp.AAC.1